MADQTTTTTEAALEIVPNAEQRDILAVSGLTDRQQALARYMALNGLSVEAAAKLAGMDARQAAASAANPRIAQAVSLLIGASMVGEGAALAWATMRKLMVAADVPHQVRFSAARWTLESAGHGVAAEALRQKQARDMIGSITNKPLSEMSVEELESMIRGEE